MEKIQKEESSEILNILNAVITLENSITGTKFQLINRSNLEVFLEAEDISKYYKTKKFRTRKTGKIRKLSIPDGRLSKIQKAISIYLSKIYKPYPCVTGFVKDRGIHANASFHKKKLLIIGLDIESFFDTITDARVFSSLSNYLPEQNALVESICKLCLYNNHLPTGSPSSPILSNMIFSQIDRKIIAVCKKHKLTYSRYGDDLTFSTNNIIPIKQVLKEIVHVVEKSNFRLNDAKTRILTPSKRQMVTGLVVNEKLNVRRDYIKDTRFFLNLLVRYGEGECQLNYNSKYAYQKEIDSNQDNNILNILKGRIEFIGHTRGKKDAIYLKLLNKLNSYKKELTTNIEIKDTIEFDDLPF